MSIEEKSVIGVSFNSQRDQVLLMKRKDVPVWTLPGGKVEKNETLEEAILREMHEETGYYFKITKMIGTYTPINRLAKKTYLFELEIISGEPSLSEETKELQFFSLSSLPQKMPVPYPEWIQDAYSSPLKPLEKKLTSITYLKCIRYIITNPILVSRFFLSRIGLPINR
jgi:ADP-ribose pyrophosphatase YjhB (NUDIX family)